MSPIGWNAPRPSGNIHGTVRNFGWENILVVVYVGDIYVEAFSDECFFFL